MAHPSLPLQRLRSLLAGERALAVVLPQARRLAELNRILSRSVPPGVARVCRLVALQGDTAVVFCAHGTAAARLRSQARSVAAALSATGDPVRTIQVKVRADWAMPEPPVKRGMAPTAIEAWADLQASLPEGALKDAVVRLLQHQRSDSVSPYNPAHVP